MRRAIVLVLVSMGCGRVAFDARVDGSTDDVGDTADAATSICHTGTWSTPVLVAATATASEEVDPGLSPDQLTLYFESNRPPSAGRAIWRTTRASITSPFGPPEIVSELDSPSDDRDPQVATDGLRLFLTTDFSSSAWIATTTHTTTSDVFAPVAKVDINGDVTASTFTPFVTADGLTLYYGHGVELAVATRPTTSDAFTYVRDLTELSSPQTDLDPTLTPDGLEIFFGSYRNGPCAIFQSTRPTTSDSFAVVSELTQLAGVNGAGAPEISRDGRTLYFWQNDGTQLDLYSSTRTCN